EGYHWSEEANEFPEFLACAFIFGVDGEDGVSEFVYQVFEVLGRVDVGVDAVAAFAGLVEDVVDEGGFADSSEGEECGVFSLADVGKELFGLFLPVAEISGAGVIVYVKRVCHHPKFTIHFALYKMHYTKCIMTFFNRLRGKRRRRTFSLSPRLRSSDKTTLRRNRNFPPQPFLPPRREDAEENFSNS